MKQLEQIIFLLLDKIIIRWEKKIIILTIKTIKFLFALRYLNNKLFILVINKTLNKKIKIK